MGNIDHYEVGQQTGLPSTPDVARVTAEVQSSIIVARKFPRDENVSRKKVLESCTRKKLAEQAAYSYSRGGADVTGPSIRLAEEIARCWGNVQYGIREISKDSTSTLYEVFCWDLESNTRVNRAFSQEHVRETRKGRKHLTESRDVYEIVASNAARRLRAVILEVLPKYIVEEALEVCEKTLTNENQADAKNTAKLMLEKFAQLNVTQEMIENRIGRKIEAITSQQVVDLRKVYQSLIDGMSSTDQWFNQKEKNKNIREDVKNATKKNT